ncbi:MAG: amino acid ABC transporter permease [Lachnospiraceae bacterium]|nr:amino acid ABC transporter permease [Lachnospiraceae bacterium]
MDATFFQTYLPLYVKAAELTLQIGLFGIFLAVLVGLICSTILYFRIPVLRQIVSIYIELSRNTPLLVQLFFLYFALPKIGIVWSAELCAVIGLTFLGGSYMTEAFRSGLEAVDKIQFESAASLGMNRVQAMRYVIIPQALATSVPSLVANVIFLLKETSVFSGIALADLMYVAKDLIGLYYKSSEALLMLVIAYLIILLPISLLGILLERRLRYAGFGH